MVNTTAVVATTTTTIIMSTTTALALAFVTYTCSTDPHHLLHQHILFGFDKPEPPGKEASLPEFYGGINGSDAKVAPRIMGLDTCARFMATGGGKAAGVRLVAGPAGLFNTGTNLMEQLLRTNCKVSWVGRLLLRLRTLPTTSYFSKRLLLVPEHTQQYTSAVAHHLSPSPAVSYRLHHMDKIKFTPPTTFPRMHETAGWRHCGRCHGASITPSSGEGRTSRRAERVSRRIWISKCGVGRVALHSLWVVRAFPTHPLAPTHSLPPARSPHRQART